MATKSTAALVAEVARALEQELTTRGQPSRDELLAALQAADDRLEKAEDVAGRVKRPGLMLVAEVYAARLEFKNALAELDAYDAARSVRSVYAADLARWSRRR